MISTWDELLTHLNIDENALTDNDMRGLLSWYKTHLSSEKTAAHYNEIKHDLNHYFDTIPHYSQHDRLEAQSALKELNVIQFAALEGYDQYLEQLLSEDTKALAAIDAVNAVGMSALHFAVLAGFKKTATLLLRFGAVATKVNQHEQTILHLALTPLPHATEIVVARKLELFMFLKKSFPDLLEKTDLSGENVAHILAKSGQTKLLLALHKDCPTLLDKTNHFGCSALHLAILNQRFETAKSLASIQSLMMLCDSDGKLPIHYAAFYADTPLLKIVLNPKQIDLTDYYLKTPLLFSAEAGHLDSVTYLSSVGANVLQKDIRELSLLHYAALSKNLELVRWLLDHTSIDINVTDKLGRTALITLVLSNILMDAKTEIVLDYLIENGGHLDRRDQSGRSVIDYIQDLLTKGTKISAALCNKMGIPYANSR